MRLIVKGIIDTPSPVGAPLVGAQSVQADSPGVMQDERRATAGGSPLRYVRCNVWEGIRGMLIGGKSGIELGSTVDGARNRELWDVRSKWMNGI